MPSRILVIAESDSSATSGIQVDIKTALALGGYAMTAISTLIAQDDRGIQAKSFISPNFVGEQVRIALNNCQVAAIKIGFLPDEATVNIVADVLEEYRNNQIPVVIDPSIVLRGGKVLVDNKAIAAWKRRLFVDTKIMTPNLIEAELLGGMKIHDIEDMRNATKMMRTLGVETIVLKGGQLENEKELYFIGSENSELIYERAHIDTPHTLGAGSTFSCGLAIGLAQKMNTRAAIEHALDFMHQSILHSAGFGSDIGPVDHGFNFQDRTISFRPEEIKIFKVQDT